MIEKIDRALDEAYFHLGAELSAASLHPSVDAETFEKELKKMAWIISEVRVCLVGELESEDD